MINAQHDHIYRIHTLHFILEKYFFLKFYQYSPYYEILKIVLQGHPSQIGRCDRLFYDPWMPVKSKGPWMYVSE